MVKMNHEINPPDILVEVSRSVCSIYNFYKADDLMEKGKQATEIRNYEIRK